MMAPKWMYESDGDKYRKDHYLVAYDNEHAYRIDCESKKKAIELKKFLNRSNLRVLKFVDGYYIGMGTPFGKIEVDVF